MNCAEGTRKAAARQFVRVLFCRSAAETVAHPGALGIALCCIGYYRRCMTTITCKIPEKLDAELEALARRERTSKSTIVRQALEKRIGRARKKAAPSALGLVKSLCGSLRGPVDLASNPCHMEGFGA
jgi:predicted transcriptional regulator